MSVEAENDERRPGGAALDDGYHGRPEVGSPNLVHLGVSAQSDGRLSTGRRYARYFEWIRAIRDAPTTVLPARVKGTLLMLGTYSNPEGREIMPSLRTLGSRVGKSDDAVGRDLRIALDAGYLHRWRPTRDSQYHYRLTLPVEPARVWDREPAPVWDDLLRRPTQAKTPSASSPGDLPLDEDRGSPSDDGAPLDDSTTEDTMKTFSLDYGPSTLDESLALGGLTLDGLPADLRERTLDAYSTKTGRAIVNYCATHARGNAGRFAALLDEPRVAFRVTEHGPYGSTTEHNTAEEAAATIEQLRERDARVTLRAAKGDEADDWTRPF